MKLVLFCNEFPKTHTHDPEYIKKNYPYRISNGSITLPITQEHYDLVMNNAGIVYPDVFGIMFNLEREEVIYHNSIKVYKRTSQPITADCLKIYYTSYAHFIAGKVPMISNGSIVLDHPSNAVFLKNTNFLPCFKGLGVRKTSIATFQTAALPINYQNIIPYVKLGNDFLIKKNNRVSVLPYSPKQIENILYKVKFEEGYRGDTKLIKINDIIKTLSGIDQLGRNLNKISADMCVAGYHSLKRSTRSSGNFNVGVEIEKEDLPIKVSATFKAIDLLTRGWIKEYDGSLNGSGFELVSPVFDLFSNDLENEINEHRVLEEHINASYSKRCGGHINISSSHHSPTELFNKLSGYLPLLYAMYPNRIRTTYSLAKKKKNYTEGDHYAAVNILSNRIEFRIFPAVANVAELMWRLKLIRYMCNNLGATENQVYSALKDESSELRAIIQEYYDNNCFNNVLYTNRFSAKTLESGRVASSILNLVKTYSLKYNDNLIKI